MEKQNPDKLPTSPILPIAKQVLLSFVDVYRYAIPMFDKAGIYRIPIKYYDKLREEDRVRFTREIYRLKRNKFVKKYFDDKGHYLELLPKGEKRIKEYMFEDLSIKSPQKWDKKWRLVTYDIPDNKKSEREMIKYKLENLGFLKLQESLYVYPFECLEQIIFIKENYFLGPYV